MNVDRREYAFGTYVDNAYPWGLYVSARALCADGKVRKVKRISETADTFFSVPASVTVKGKTVSGYITVSSIEGYDTVTFMDPAVVKFVAYKYGKNWELLKDDNDE